MWLQDRFQAGRVQSRFSNDERRTFLRHLTAAEGLERYLATKYPAQKRFSLEGGDALIPMLDDLIQQLEELRRACPAAGSALCVGFLDHIRYAGGEVRFSYIDPRQTDVFELKPKTRAEGQVH